ncbi:ABC transporter ATP-binding protein [Falsirhodobacter sp. 20TX0035]|uniref:ABC transporter ATP-binding protein n=1 Tax=Falsirhodobacter sp. 20TX0035 TaxID=3022019 RepID=UPI00232C8781|nr:ABC transporter ATP-binding protein [Falsirhodobacter sp. 20TX0035]MDB6454434.1 ABC transporter ATP-binding protein [Falsirhodobacter sp. 20TX0035]
MAQIDLHDVSLRFGVTTAVDAVSFSIPSGAFFALLGPSGCGKTSLLRLLAGLERPSAGRIVLGGRTVAGGGTFVDPGARGLGMVFQSYALWPHMTVAGNVAFGLKMQRIPAAERDRRVQDALEVVGLGPLASRKPHELSGGQRQRVALARSLAVRPTLILLDEPLANLDAHLRQSMLTEFRRIHAETGATFVFVTHDQNEAMAVATHVGVMNAGRMEQLDTPDALFDRPATPMVARFVGHGRTLAVEVRDGLTHLPRTRLRLPGAVDQGPAWLCLRPRDLAVAEDGPLAGRVVGRRMENGMHMLSVLPDDLGDIPLDVAHDRAVPVGTPVTLQIRSAWLLPRDGDPMPRTAEALPA